MGTSLFIFSKAPDLNSLNPKPSQGLGGVVGVVFQVLERMVIPDPWFGHLHLGPTQAVEFGDH